MTDSQLLAEIQYHTLEAVNSGTSWVSGLWTVDEVSDYLNRRHRRFLVETGVVLTTATIATTPNVEHHQLPSDWMVSRRVVWHGVDSYVPLKSGDTIQADSYGGASYNLYTRPSIYIDTEVPSLQIRIAPASQDNGAIELWYIAKPAALSNLGISLAVPDEMASVIKWGVMADMLSKVGRAMDPERAAYCEERYNHGVEAAKMLMLGFE